MVPLKITRMQKRTSLKMLEAPMIIFLHELTYTVYHFVFQALFYPQKPDIIKPVNTLR